MDAALQTGFTLALLFVAVLFRVGANDFEASLGVTFCVVCNNHVGCDLLGFRG
jgi:hypothetical protein